MSDVVKIKVIDRGASIVLSKLTEAGYEAYLVGGCVRDAVLGRPIKDIDIATSALPEQVMSCFPRTAPTGLQHGTVTVILAQGTYEVTTFRKETEYEGFRRPASVEYISDLTEDLKRRDFTMNAMAMDAAGVVLDPFAGQKDLADGCTPLRRGCGGAFRRRCAAHASLCSFCLDLWTGGRSEYVASAACASSAAAPHRYGARAQRAAAHGRRPSPRTGCAVTAGEPPHGAPQKAAAAAF